MHRRVSFPSSTTTRRGCARCCCTSRGCTSATPPSTSRRTVKLIKAINTDQIKRYSCIDVLVITGFAAGTVEGNNSTIPIKEALKDGTRTMFHYNHLKFVRKAIQ
jgi:hypothetical protein